MRAGGALLRPNLLRPGHHFLTCLGPTCFSPCSGQTTLGQTCRPVLVLTCAGQTCLGEDRFLATTTDHPKCQQLFVEGSGGNKTILSVSLRKRRQPKASEVFTGTRLRPTFGVSTSFPAENRRPAAGNVQQESCLKVQEEGRGREERREVGSFGVKRSWPKQILA